MGGMTSLLLDNYNASKPNTDGFAVKLQLSNAPQGH